MSNKLVKISLILVLVFATNLMSQEKEIIIPKPVPGSPYVINDTEDLFGKAWRFYRDGFGTWAADSLRKLIDQSGLEMKKNNYYVVVANFNPAETVIGMYHGNDSFLSTRLYGLKADSLYYIYISRNDSAKHYLSTVITRKGSYFEENLLNFILLFPFISGAKAQVQGKYVTYIDVRKYEIPKKFQEYSDISIIVKKDFYDDRFLAQTVLDNSSLEKWSYGIATAITSIDDVDIIVDGGTIVVRPKPWGDLATFGVINFNFKAVDTKAKSMATSFHLLGGLRISTTIEPILGVGIGLPAGFIDVHFFAGYSVEFANELKTGYFIGKTIDNNTDPFKLKIRGKPRFGIEVKFP
jgi:hypothetical protein